jgi:hypothetical protein
LFSITFCFEPGSFHGYVTFFWEAFEFESLDDSLWSGYLVDYAVEAEVVAASLVDVSVGTAAFDVESVDDHGQVAGARPLDDQFWISVGLEDQFAGSFEFPAD